MDAAVRARGGGKVLKSSLAPLIILIFKLQLPATTRPSTILVLLLVDNQF